MREMYQCHVTKWHLGGYRWHSDLRDDLKFTRF